ncbi:MAG: DUF2938 domain-containing protein [Beijerinckiaceae bacterium]
MSIMELVWRSIVVGIGATVILDLWALLLNRLFGFGLPNWAMVGRWVAHWRNGIFAHNDIAAASPAPAELATGWIFHYLVGIAFAMATYMLGGAVWAKAPTLPIPMFVGVITVGFGWFVLQPALGAGMAASRKPDATRIRILNIVGHIVFGLGMWLAARMIAG